MKIKYLPQDNEARINNGVCRYKGFPYLIGLVTQTELMLSPIYRKEGANSESIKVYVDDPNLDISSPPLGYVNSSRGLFYLVRRPERRYKQTLSAQGVLCFRPGENTNHEGGDLTHSVFHSNACEKMFIGDYPSYTKVLSDIRSGKGSSYALSREVAIHNGTVLVKNERVGDFNIETETLKLVDSEYKWIAERVLLWFPWKIE